MLGGSSYTLRYAVPIRFQALPRHRRLLASSSLRAALAALARREEMPTVYSTFPGRRDTTNSSVGTGKVPSDKDTLRSLLNAPYTPKHFASFTESLARYVKDDALMSNVSFCELLAQTAAHFGKFENVHTVMTVAGQHGTSFTSGGYENVIRQWIRHKSWAYAYDFCERAMESPSLVTSRLLRLRIQALSGLKLYKPLRQVLDLHLEYGVPRTRKTYNLLIRASLDAQDVSWARSLLETMEGDGFAFDSSTYATILNGLRVLGPSQDIESHVYASLRELGLLSNQFCLNALMQFRLDAGDTKGAMTISDLFQENADLSEADRLYKPSSSLDSNGHIKPFAVNPFPPNPTLQSLPASSISSTAPTLSTYNIFLNQSAKEGAVSRSLAIWGQIHDLGFVPTDYTVVAVVRTLLGGNSPRRAEAVTFVASCLYGAQSRRSREFCERLGFEVVESDFIVQTGALIRPSTPIFNALLSGLLCEEEDNSLSRMDGLLEEWNLGGIEPDADTLSIFLSYLERHVRLDSAELLQITDQLTRAPKHETLDRASPSGSTFSHSTMPLQAAILPNLRHMNIALRAMMRRTQVLEVQPAPTSGRVSNSPPPNLRHMRSFSGRSPISAAHTATPTDDLQGNNTTLSSNPSLLTRWRDLLHERGEGAGDETWQSRIRLGDPDSSQAAFDEMRRRGIVPKAQHYMALIQTFVQHRHLASASHVLLSAIVAGIITTTAMFTVLIVAYGKLGKPELAQRTFDRMRSQAHLVPDVASVDALARAYINSGQASEARKVVLDHWALVDKQYAERSPAFWDNLKALRLKALLYALSGLSGAQRKGGKKAISQARRMATKRIVHRVVQRWKGEGTVDSPKKPVMSRRTRSAGDSSDASV